MSKNICMFAANYLPNIGGVERYNFYLAKYLLKKGHKVTIVTNNVFGLKSHEIIDGVEIYRIDCHNVMNGRYPIYKHGKNLRNTLAELKDKKFDFVVVHTRFYFHSILGAKFAYKNNIPCITIEHGSAHSTINNKVLDKMGEWLEHAVTARLKHYCKHFYGVSKAACDWSGHFGIKSEGVLYNAIDLSEIEEKLSRANDELYKKYNIPDDAVVVLYASRLVEEKGILKLMQAVRNLKDKNVYLLICGAGPCEEEVKKQVEQEKEANLIMLGSLKNEQVVSLLKRSDIACLPSRAEGLSTSVLEAVATKTFMITSERGGSKELLINDDYGIILPGIEVSDIETALRKVVADKAYREKAVENSYKRLKEHFVWEETTQSFLKVVEKY